MGYAPMPEQVEWLWEHDALTAPCDVCGDVPSWDVRVDGEALRCCRTCAEANCYGVFCRPKGRD